MKTFDALFAELSERARTRPMAMAQARHSTPIATALERQPTARMRPGTSAPASMPPSGTPVCFTAKISEKYCGGVRTRMAELAGVAGP